MRDFGWVDKQGVYQRVKKCFGRACKKQVEVNFIVYFYLPVFKVTRQ